MAQWRSVAASLDRCRWIGLGGPWSCSSPSPSPSPRPPFRAPVPATRRADARRNVRIGCASVPRELGAAAEAEQTARPVAIDGAEEGGVACEGCGGAGWVLCDFCEGKKNNVRSESSSSRVYRRCPTCKAAGFVLCPRCRVYKCITFPESNVS